MGIARYCVIVVSFSPTRYRALERNNDESSHCSAVLINGNFYVAFLCGDPNLKESFGSTEINKLTDCNLSMVRR